MTTWSYIFLGLFGFAHLALAQIQEASVVATKGNVQILSRNGSGPKVKFDEQIFYSRKARIGSKIQPKEMIHSGPDGQLKAVYPSGEQIVVGPGSAFECPTSKKSAAGDDSVARLVYGKVRALIVPKGAMNNLKLKTRGAVAGVRGTDFFVSYNDAKGAQVSVLRGEVALTPVSSVTQKELAQPVTVASGFTGQVKAITDSEATKEGAGETKRALVEVEPATKERLLQVQSASSVKIEAEDLKALNEKQKAELVKLEENSRIKILEEIKKEQPQVFEQLKSQTDGISLNDINAKVVSQLYKKAPTEPDSPLKTKPTAKEMEDAIGSDIYKKYFQD